MDKEIEEILDFIKKQIEKETLSYEPDVELSKEEAKLLLDYITNLQEENERLNLELSGYREAILRDDKLLGLKSIINKAIEYIEIIQYNESYGVKEKDYLKLLDILKGG